MLHLGQLRPIYQITTNRDFSEPVAELEMGKVWHRDDVERWIKRYRPDLDADDVH